jgi:hypothetical protein
MNIKKGDILKYKDDRQGTTKVLAVINDLYAIARIDDQEIASGWCTLKKIEELFIIPEQPWEPVIGQTCWGISIHGIAYPIKWEGGIIDLEVRDFLGVFPSESEALAQRDKIKQFLGK